MNRHRSQLKYDNQRFILLEVYKAGPGSGCVAVEYIGRRSVNSLIPCPTVTPGSVRIMSIHKHRHMQDGRGRASLRGIIHSGM